MISVFPPDNGRKVFCSPCWWGDRWHPCDFGVDYDFSKTFSEQFAGLVRRVPLPPLVVGDSENSDYTNYAYANKNCYLVFGSDYNEDCYYLTYAFRCRNCVDCLVAADSELLYQSVDCKGCYGSSYLQACHDCVNCIYCYDCRGCHDCLFCAGLRKKQFCILNQQCSKLEYEKKSAELLQDIGENGGPAYQELLSSRPRKYADIENCERSTGDHLNGCKNAHCCFDLIESEDCRYVALGLKTRDCCDGTGAPGSELCYEVAASPENYGLLFSAVTWPKSSFLLYCLFCRASQHCFGSVSLQRQEFCILNKQYSAEDYEHLVGKIIRQMQNTGEWGEFLSPSLSPYGYNETVAQDFFPLSRKTAAELGFPWSDYQAPAPSAKRVLSPEEMAKLPGGIEQIPDEIIDWALTCAATGRTYRITRQELSFYRKQGIALPRYCPEQRHLRRLSLRAPRTLYPRTCVKCGKEVLSPYELARREEVYCEECYLKEVY